MKKFKIFFAALLIITICAYRPAMNYFAAPSLKQIASIDLPGKAGKRFDYLTIDYDHNYLLSAHLGAGVLYVIDLKKNNLVKMIEDTRGAEGVKYVPKLKKVYPSNGGDKSIGVIDIKKIKVKKKIPAISK